MIHHRVDFPLFVRCSQEKRASFDIHKYGKSVLTKVASMLPPAERVKAQEAVKGTEKVKYVR